MKLLIVEDDHGLAEGIAFSMGRDGYELSHAGTIAAARKLLETESPDVVLLDLNLPDGDGIAFCREIRETSQVPILMLTARDLETDEVRGLLSGADDYLTKPFSLAVLKARLDTVLRRSKRPAAGQTGRGAFYGDTIDRMGGEQGDGTRGTDGKQGAGMRDSDRERMLVCGEIRLLPGNMKVWRGEREVECSATEFRLLHYLMENRGQVLLKEQILGRVWDSSGNFVDENTLQVTVGRLRRKLEKDPSNPAYIRTVHGLGYIFAQ